MQGIVDGILSFQNNVFNQEREMFESLVAGQHPQALLITCSDSRIDVGRLTQTQPGDLFVQRTAGNIVPPYDAILSGEAATIEYAVLGLGIEHIIVCGHSHCGAMKGLLHPETLEQLPAVKAYLTHAESVRQAVEEKQAASSDAAAKLMLAVQQNVLVQLDNLRTHPSVAGALEDGKLQLHGWVYQLETGEVLACDKHENEFVSLRETALASAERGNAPSST